jgi:hypothetical protein
VPISGFDRLLIGATKLLPKFRKPDAQFEVKKKTRKNITFMPLQHSVQKKTAGELLLETRSHHCV